MAKLVIEKYLDDFKTVGKTILDYSFNELPFLVANETIYNDLGEKVSKLYTDKKGRKAVEIFYKKVISDYKFENQIYKDIFIGVRKEFHFFDWSGKEIIKNKLPYYFNLISKKDSNGNVLLFTSYKKDQILNSEKDYVNFINQHIY